MDGNTTPPPKLHTVLIVDDNPTNLGVLSNYLKDSGLRILVARSGDSALKKARYAHPDLILLDIMMPGVDGFETCRQLKAHRRTHDIPVIFMTALAEAEDKIRGFNAGAVDYITKPLQHEEVLARVSAHLKIRDLTQNLQKQNIRLQKTTSDLQSANTVLSKRNAQLEISSQVGQRITSFLDLDELLQQVVPLIRTKFDYYFVGVWLLDETWQKVMLRAGSGAAGVSPPQDGLDIALSKEDSAIVWVCRQGEQRILNDVRRELIYLALAELPEAKSELVLPLRGGQNVIGVLDIVSNRLAAFAKEDVIVLQSLADQIAMAILNARLYERERRRRKLAEALVHTGRVLSGSLDLREVPERILEELVSVVPYERGSVLLERGVELRSIAMRGYPSENATRELHIFINQGGVFERITRTRSPILIGDVTKDPGWQQLEWLPLDYSWLGVPLIVKDRVIGMISLTRHAIDAFSQEDATSVLAFAGQAAIALENASLYGEINQFNEQLEAKVVQRTEELNEAYQALERLDRKKSDFINVTSHELRTPLSVIRGYAQLIQMAPDIGEDKKTNELLEGMIQGVDRLTQIVDTMLDVVKIDTEVLEVGNEPTFLAKILQILKEKFDDNLQERELCLTLDNLEDLPTIEANPDLIVKVFHNLIINAIKYTPDGGKITISGQTVTLNGNPSVEVMISDTGIGIDPEHREQIFEKFYQVGQVAVHSTGQTKFKGGGPGLGLSIAEGIVTAHGGKIWAESEGYDEINCPGSRFHVVLPVRQPTSQK